MEDLYREISKYIFGALIGVIVWLLKGAFKEYKELKAQTLHISTKVDEHGFKIKTIETDVNEVKETIKTHDKRLDKHDRDINTIVTTHNLTECAKSNKIEL